MIFLTKDDFQSLITKPLLAELIQGDETLFNITEATAIAELTGYVGAVYDINKMIKEVGESRNSLFIVLLSKIALYYLYKRQRMLNDSVENEYLATLGLLKDVRKGVGSLPFPLQPPPEDPTELAAHDPAFAWTSLKKRNNNYI